jgi:hypothetical protein
MRPTVAHGSDARRAHEARGPPGLSSGRSRHLRRDHRPGPGRRIAGLPAERRGDDRLLLGTAVAVTLAEFSSEVVGTETSERHRVTRHQLRHLFDDAAAVAFGVAVPAVSFLPAAVGVIRTEAAFTPAKWGGFDLIGFYGYWTTAFPALRFSGAWHRPVRSDWSLPS